MGPTPRCGCQDSCSCLIVAGDGVAVEGIGTLERPYEISSESGTLIGRLEYDDSGGVDFTAAGIGTVEDPLTVSAEVALRALSDVPSTTPANGQVPVWRTDRWLWENQSGSGSGTPLPPGGADGQVLTKASATSGDVGWETPAVASVAPSGSWGISPLSTTEYGTAPSTQGLPIYVDTAGKLRTQPVEIANGTKTASTPITSYPLGLSIMSTVSTDLWPVAAGGTVTTIRQIFTNYAGYQIWSRNNGKTLSAVYFRQASVDGWSDWVGFGGNSVAGQPWQMAAGKSSVSSPAPNTGVSLAITFPALRFTVPPIVTASPDSNGYGAATAAGATKTGVTLRYFNPTASTPTGCFVHWIAVQMSSSLAAG